MCLLRLPHLYGNDVLSSAGKSFVHWGISPVKPSLNGRESSIIAEALCSLGHHISQGLHKCLGRENLIVAEAPLLTEVFLVTGLDISAHVWALFNGFLCRFSLPGSEGLML